MKRSRVLRAVAAGCLAVFPFGLTSSAHADAGSLGGWNISADGNVIDFLFDNATGLAGIHPFTEADFPEAQSVFQTGPFGSGLATMFWPGSAGGNFGSLSGELGVPSQLTPITSKLNDPVRAASEYPAGPTSATYPAGGPGNAFVMKAESTEKGTTATAALSDANQTGVLTYGSAKGTSSATVDSKGHAVAKSVSTLKDVWILGLIHIGSITSTATASSDGTNSVGSAVTHIGEITVAGQKASLGSDGLVLPNLGGPVGSLLGNASPLEAAVNKFITSAGISFQTLPSAQTHKGAAFSITSGGLQIKIVPPAGGTQALESLEPVLSAILPPQAATVATLPGIFQGAVFTITLGRATASSAASPAFSFNFTPPPIPPPTVPSTSSSLPSTGGSTPVIADQGSPTDNSGGGPELSSTPTPSTVPTGSLPTGATPISLSSPLAAAAIILGLIVSAGLGYGLWRVARMVLPEDSGPVCPLGQENP